MTMNTQTKARNPHVLRKVNQWVRQHPGGESSPSQLVMESNTRDAYFWRR